MSEADSREQEVRLRALIRGRVQGVFFRHFTRSQAQRLGLVGTVRNLPGGTTVEVLAEGPRPALEQLLSYLREGPPGASVAQVVVEWGVPRGGFGSFMVR